MGHIFISYSRKDEEYVNKLVAAIENEGFDVWIDRELLTGDKWIKTINHQIDTCDAFVIVMTDDSSRSQWVQREVLYAIQEGKRIFPLLLQGKLWMLLQDFNYFQVTDASIPSKKFFKDIEKIVPRSEVWLATQRETIEKARQKLAEEERQRIAKEKAARDAAREKVAKEALARQTARREFFAKFFERTKQYLRLVSIVIVIGLLIWGGVAGISSFFPESTETPIPTSTKISTYTPPAKTLTPTSTKTKIPTFTATSRPTTFSVYDDFPVNLALNYNKNLWSGSSDKIKWQNGYLYLSGTDSGAELRPKVPSNWKITQIGRLQADLRIDKVSGPNYAFTKLGIDTTLSDGKGVWWAQCRAGSFDGINAQIICDSYRWGDGPEILYQTTSYPIEFGKFYSVAIDLAHDGSTIRYYVDGQEIGSYAPDVKALLEKAVFSWSIGIYIEEGSSATGAIDNVMVGSN